MQHTLTHKQSYTAPALLFACKPTYSFNYEPLGAGSERAGWAVWPVCQGHPRGAAEEWSKEHPFGKEAEHLGRRPWEEGTYVHTVCTDCCVLVWERDSVFYCTYKCNMYVTHVGAGLWMLQLPWIIMHAELRAIACTICVLTKFCYPCHLWLSDKGATRVIHMYVRTYLGQMRNQGALSCIVYTLRFISFCPTLQQTTYVRMYRPHMSFSMMCNLWAHIFMYVCTWMRITHTLWPDLPLRSMNFLLLMHYSSRTVIYSFLLLYRRPSWMKSLRPQTWTRRLSPWSPGSWRLVVYTNTLATHAHICTYVLMHTIHAYARSHMDTCTRALGTWKLPTLW